MLSKRQPPKRNMCHVAANMIGILVNSINSNLSEYSPTTIVAGSVAATTAVLTGDFTAATIVLTFATVHFAKKAVENANKDMVAKLLVNIPFSMRFPVVGVGGPELKAKLEKEKKDAIADLQKGVDESYAPWVRYTELPEKGLTRAEIDARFAQIGTHKHPAKNSGATYAFYTKEEKEMQQTVWSIASLTNTMHASQNPEINLCEAELISALQKLLNNPNADAHGMVTNGGTFSNLHAVFAYVSIARANGITTPEIIVPSTAHASFDKAAEYSGAKLVKVPVNPETGAADVAAMQKAINFKTCMLVGSAPSFPCGVYDPIEELGAVAVEEKLPLHVDACLGGFLNIFAKRAGRTIPPCDYSVKGVTSLSLDTHKYGETAKGNSVITFLRSNLCIHVNTKWEGGLYVSPGMAGSRSGADIAGPWALIFSRGVESYVNSTKAIFALKDALVEKIQQIEGICIPYPTPFSVIAIKATPGLNLLLVETKLSEDGWNFNISQSSDQKRHGLHFCLTSVHVNYPGFADLFIQALQNAVQFARLNPDAKLKSMARVYGAFSKFVPAPLQQKLGEAYIETQFNIDQSSQPSVEDLEKQNRGGFRHR